MHDPRAFAQFRRLLLGVVVEVLADGGVDVEVAGLRAEFSPESGFRMLWFDNWMRFRGTVRAPLRSPVGPAAAAEVRDRLGRVWPEIVGAVSVLPLADRLEIVRQEIEVTFGEALEIRFDLEAD